jgi:hypothetical protein
VPPPPKPKLWVFTYEISRSGRNKGINLDVAFKKQNDTDKVDNVVTATVGHTHEPSERDSVPGR